MEVECKICKLKCKNMKSFLNHLRYQHPTVKTKMYYDTYLKEDGEGTCKTCKIKNTTFISVAKGYREYCCSSCTFKSSKVRNKSNNTLLKKYGVKNPSQSVECLEKRKNTCMEKYGQTNVFKNSKIKEKIKSTFKKKYEKRHPSRDNKVRKQIKKTCQERYGVDAFLCSDTFQEKRTKTWEEKYEKRHPARDIKVKEKTADTCKERYGLDYTTKFQKKREETFKENHHGLTNPFQLAEVRQKADEVKKQARLKRVEKVLKNLNMQLLEKYQRSQDEVRCRCTKCNTVFKTCLFYLDQGYGFCPSCYADGSISEKEVANFVVSLGVEQYKDKKLIKPLELDIYIPDKKIAIEYNGLYWHNEQFKNKNYHLNKLKKCVEKNIQLIQIFEDEWIFKQDIVKARLKQILNINNTKRIHARKCIVKEINAKIKNEFLERYHLQSKDNSKVKLGAFYVGELVAVMTFSVGNIAKGSHFQPDVWELNRFCSNYNYHIPGIASKLLTYFKRNYEWKEIFSYADRRWSNGNLYYKLGFELEKETQPGYWYVKNLKRIYRYNLRKRPGEPKDIPEQLLRAGEGYLRIWDCGNLKFRIVNKK